MSIKIIMIVTLLVLISLAFATEQTSVEGLKLFQKKHHNKSHCNDECILKCSQDGKEDCLNECGCRQPPRPTIEDLYVMNTCYATCGEECVALATIAERRECMQSCPCKCNTFCVSACRQIGLETVCEDTCGCHPPREPEEDNQQEREQAEQELEQNEQEEQNEQDEQNTQEEQNEQEYDEQEAEQAAQELQIPEQLEQILYEAPETSVATETEQKSGAWWSDKETAQEKIDAQQDIESARSRIEENKLLGENRAQIDAENARDQAGEITINADVSNLDDFEPIQTDRNDVEAKAIDMLISEYGPGNDFKSSVITATAAAFMDTPFPDATYQQLINDAMEEGAICQPQCWRKCLQMREGKEVVFQCIDDCGCGFESPHLLAAMQNKAEFDSLHRDHASGSIFFLLLAMITLISAVTYYIYRRETDHKLHEGLILEDDIEESGYEKLD